MENKKLLIEKARNAINLGDIAAARNSIHSIKNYINNADALYLLALCHAIKSEYIDAEKLFTKVTSLTRATDTLLVNIGLTQQHRQKIPEAIKSYHAAIKLNQYNFDALSNLAVCYDYKNDKNNAIKYAKKANRINTNNPSIINIIAEHAIYNNNIQDSIALYTKSLSLQPEQPQIYVRLANAYIIAKNYDEAENTFNKAKSLFPESPYIGNSIANYYEKRNRLGEALNQYDLVINKYKDNTRAIAGKARILTALKKFDDAKEILDHAHVTFPENPDITTELCNHYILIKNYETAYNISKSFLAEIDNNLLTYMDVSIAYITACRHTKRLSEAKNILEILIKRKDISKETIETLHFVMGDILDKMQSYDDAFQYYSIANEVIQKPSDIQYYEKVLDDISTTVDRNYLNSIGTSDNTSSLPVFIVGMPRSGTSLVEQIIASHPDAYGAGELTDLWAIGNNISGEMNLINYTKNLFNISHDELNIFSNHYINKLVEISSHSIRITDKLPHNFMHIGLIELLFPNAKIIHCKRHPFDTCLSIYFRNFNDNHVYTKKLKELARFYKKYLTLMEHWVKNSELDIYTLQYEKLVSNQEVESRKLIHQLDLEWENDVLNYFNTSRIILTPSCHQANKPIYTDSMYRWKNYRKYLRPLIDILGDPEKYD